MMMRIGISLFFGSNMNWVLNKLFFDKIDLLFTNVGKERSQRNEWNLFNKYFLNYIIYQYCHP